MKKSLVALAALAAVGAASAQSSVTLYGVLDIGYGSQTTTTRDGTGAIRSRGVMDGANAGNRIGFRGTEDLGGGLKANFVVEQGISPTSGTLFTQRAAAAGPQLVGLATAAPTLGGGQVSGANTAFSANTNRQSYVGLASDAIGTFNIGYQYTVGYELSTLSGYNIGSEGLPGADQAHVYHIAGSFGGTRANMVQYISPNFGGGFVVRAQYGSNAGNQETVTQQTAAGGSVTSAGRRYGLMLQYANGPLSASIAYTNLRSIGAGGPVGAAGVPVLQVNQNSRTANVTQLGASYDFGVVKLAGTYLTGRDGGVPGSLTVNNSFRAYQLGLSVPFGAIVPFITYGKARTDENSTGTRVEDYRQAQIGVRYSLSKRTTAYAMYGRTNNSALPAIGTIYDRDSKSIVGVQHNF